MEKIFLLKVTYSQEELQVLAHDANVMIEQLTDERLAALWQEALSDEYEGIKVEVANLTQTVP